MLEVKIHTSTGTIHAQELFNSIGLALHFISCKVAVMKFNSAIIVDSNGNTVYSIDNSNKEK